MDYVTVFQGSLADVQVMRICLEERGFLTNIRFYTIKTYYPFITGAGMFSLELQVPRDQVENALQALREIKSYKHPSRTPFNIPLRIYCICPMHSCFLLDIFGIYRMINLLNE